MSAFCRKNVKSSTAVFLQKQKSGITSPTLSFFFKRKNVVSYALLSSFKNSTPSSVSHVLSWYFLPEAPPAPAGLAAAAEKDRTAAGRGQHLAAAVRRAIAKILSRVCNKTEREGQGVPQLGGRYYDTE